MGAHYQDQAALEVATDTCLAGNVRVLQLFQCGSEAEHVARLLHLMDPPLDACIVDVGCGVGEVARLMLETRPDLGFILLNLSGYQLELCPEQMMRLQCDMHDMQLVDACADVVMVNYTLGYADLDKFMAEAARVLKPGGMLFIYDLSSGSRGARDLMREKFSYSLHDEYRVAASAVTAGFRTSPIQYPEASSAHLAPLLDDEYRATMDLLGTIAKPTVWRFTKRPT